MCEFAPISVRMAKEQALPINAEGLGGQCGRLRCCLKFEYEQYLAVNRLLPRINEMVMTPLGEARVIVGHPLKETVSVFMSEDERVREIPMSEIRRVNQPRRQNAPAQPVDEADETPQAAD